MPSFTPYAVVQQPSIKDLTYRGLAAALGGPVDLATMVMRPFGYTTPDKRVVGGSEWIGKQMEDAGLVSTARAPWQELAASMVSPSGAAKGAAVGLGKLGALGMTAWHGSQHKFDPEWLVKLPDGSTAYVGGKYNALKEVPKNATILKEFPAGRFRAEAKSTGEGAQVYGQGAYLAEAKGVGEEYRQVLSGAADKLTEATFKADPELWAAGRLYWNFTEGEVINRLKAQGYKGDPQKLVENARKRLEQELGASGYLYKTDIPDEVVAQMLDWDKPLSEQTPAVQALLRRAAEIRTKQTGWGGYDPSDLTLRGGDVVPTIGESRLQQAGIPGIRYLDQASRDAGEGTSNLVVFDPDMIRILERNGVATGAKPWMPGEYKVPAK